MKKLLKKSEVANLANVSSRTVDNWMKNGLPPFTKVGKIMRFRVEELDAALKSFSVNRRAVKPRRGI